MRTRFIAAAAALLILLAALTLWHGSTVLLASDMSFYQKIADAVRAARSGGAPSEALAWYPPLTASVFFLLGSVPGVALPAAWMALVLALTAAAALYAGLRFCARDAVLVAGSVLLTVVFLGPHAALGRFDLLVGLPLLLAGISWARGRKAESLWFAVAAASLKIVPVLLLPLFFLGSERREWRRLALHLVLAALAFTALPALLIGPGALLRSLLSLLSFHAGRGVQVESAWSGAQMILGALTGRGTAVMYDHYAQQNAELGTAVTAIAAVAVLGGVAWLYLRAWRASPAARLEPLAIPLLLWAIAASPVLSPPYLAWVAPLLIAWLLARTGDRATAVIAILAASALLLTQWIYPPLYPALIRGQTPFAIAILNLRNLALFLLVFALLREDIVRGMRAPGAVGAVRVWLSRAFIPFARIRLFARAHGIRTHRWVLLGAGALILFLLCAFKVMDRDFWWHITAGEVMWRTHGLIGIDPFAFTREGLPYVATHEWLAQILLYLVHRIGSINGVILFRTAMAFGIGGLLLAIGRRGQAHWNAILALLALIAARPFLLERPQIFSFVLFAAFLLLAQRFLASSLRQVRRRILAALVLLTVLWANLHGAAALLGAGIVSLLALQEGWVLWRAGGLRAANPARREWFLLCGAAGLALTALLVTPNGFETLRYLRSLQDDGTVLFIREWLPRPLGEFVLDYWWLLAASVAALAWTRRSLVFWGGLLLAMLILSRTAVRHEAFLALGAGAALIAGLRDARPWQRLLDALDRRAGWPALLTALTALLLLTGMARSAYVRYAAQDHLYGYGAFDLARGAVDFLERERTGGRWFNTYGIGGYLMHRGYPGRKVFIDGRNVDYGFAFMDLTFRAGKDPAAWKELEDRYGLTVALVDYNVVREEGEISYARHLGRNPAWALVYLDDWVAVYVKDTPENRELIGRRRFALLTPHLLESNTFAARVADADIPVAEEELRRVIADNPEGIKARVELGKLLVRRGRTAEAAVLARAALRAQPMRPEPYAVLAGAYGAEGRWAAAADAILAAVRLAGGNYPGLNVAAAADVLRKGGRPMRAWWMTRGLAAAPVTAAPPAPAGGSGASLPPDLNWEPDIQKNIDQGIAAAEEGDFPAAREAFLRALMYDPGRPVILSNLCALELQAGDAAKAEEYCRRALERDQDFADAHYNLALVFLRKGDRKQAREQAEAAKRGGKDIESLLRAIDGAPAR